MKTNSIRFVFNAALSVTIAALVGCSGDNKNKKKEAPAPDPAPPTVSTEPPPPAPTESKEEKNARLEALYSQGEKKKQDSEQTARAAHAEEALSKLTFGWTSAPSFRRAGGKAVLDLDAKSYVPTSAMKADRYKTPAFTKTGQVSAEKSATLTLIRKAYAARDWLALVNLGGKTKYTSYPSISRIDKAVSKLALGVELRVGRDPYQLHIYYPGDRKNLNYLSISHNKVARCRTIGYGKGAAYGNILRLPDSNEYLLRFYANDIAPSLVVGPVDLKRGPLAELNQKHVAKRNQILARMNAGEIHQTDGKKLLEQADDELKKAFLTWVAKN